MHATSPNSPFNLRHHDNKLSSKYSFYTLAPQTRTQSSRTVPPLTTPQNQIVPPALRSDSKNSSPPGITFLRQHTLLNPQKRMNVATITHSLGSQAPTVSKGKLTIDVLECFKHHARHFFKAKCIPANKQVSRILYSFEDRAVSLWCTANEEHFEALLFPAFIGKICERWLSTNWFIEYGKILLSPQRDSMFLEWVAHMRNANLILKSKPDIHLNDEHLRNNIRILMNDDLLLEYNTVNGNVPGKLNSIEDLDKWISAITHMDDGICTKHECKHCQYLDHLADFKKEPRRPLYVPNSSSGMTSSTNFKCNYALKLKEKEQTLLAVNDRCNNCRQLWIGKDHACKHKNSTLPFLEITHNYVELERARLNKPTAGATRLTTMRIAAIIEDSSNDDTPMYDADDFADYTDEYVLPHHIYWSGDDKAHCLY
ncbi:hypothetical protein C0991_002316 [Blastosporella zonata]|nr:hypothetical protein C0991_002316 [Blastosporella zonata]